MFFLILFMLVLLFFPWLLMPLVLFVIINLLLLPYSFTLQSIFTLLRAPGQLIKIGTNKCLRMNHALEHATINVIEETYGPQSISGMAYEDGFVIRGAAANPRVIRESAEIGLQRLKNGERDLVIHRRCGTSITVANLVSSIIFIALLVYTGNINIWNVVIALALANLIGPFLGSWVQKYITTSVDVEGMEISGIEFEESYRRNFLFVSRGLPDKFIISTRQGKQIEVV